MCMNDSNGGAYPMGLPGHQASNEYEWLDQLANAGVMISLNLVNCVHKTAADIGCSLCGVSPEVFFGMYYHK